LSLVVASLGFGLITASILAVAAVGFTLQFGVTNILNIAYGDLMTTGAFVAYIFNATFGINIWVCLLAGAASVAVVSVLLNRYLYMPFARRGTSLFGMIVVTIAVSLIVQDALQAIWGPCYFTYRMSAGPTLALGSLSFTVSQIAVIAIAVVAMLGVHTMLSRTRLGKAMRAVAADASLARSCGIPTGRVIDMAWLVSGALCGLAGVTLAMDVTSFSFGTGNGLLIILIAAAVLGGIGQPYGAMLGALVIGMVTELVAIVQPSYKDAIAFVILAIVLLVRPRGILAEVASEKEVAT
jgi:branched-subunit amino acid ABC-type transport system permease component